MTGFNIASDNGFKRKVNFEIHQNLLKIGNNKYWAKSILNP